MTSAKLLIVLLVGLVVGALTGLALGGVPSGPYLAVVAGFLATIVAGIARNTIMSRRGTADVSRIPVVVIVFAVIASLAGSSAAVEIAEHTLMSSPALIGALAGLFSSILMAMLMITYHMKPEEHSSKRR
jgi:hypothetical protein